NQDKLKLAVLQTEIEDAAKKIQDYKTKLGSLKKEFEEVKSSGEKKLEWESKKKDVDSNIQILSEIKSGVSELNKLRASYQNIIEDFNTAEANRIKAEEDLTHKRHLFNLEQAGILAQSLKEGLPCPVCGSTEHPHPADKSTDAPTEKEIEDKEKEVSLLQNSAQKKAQDASAAKTQFESLESLLEEKIKKHSPAHSLSDSDLRDFLNAADAESKAQLQLVQQMIDSESKNQQKKSLIEKQIPELEQQINSLSEIHAKANTDFASLQSQIAEKEKNLIELKSKLKSENADTAQKRLSELSQKIESLDSTLENARTNKTESEKNLSSLEGAAKTISEELAKMQTHNGEKLNALRTELEQKKNELNNRRDKMTGRNKANCDSVENIARLLPEYKASDEELTMINMLYRVASGSVTGQEKVSLETYVQMTFLNRITRRANLRLKIMTDGKYELCRRTVAADKRSALGLELDVKDFYTGRTRNVESLSGGEQFEASLALALGLADEIQASEGGCKLDAMFIDEGFGTLDSETLNKAMKALEDLSRGDKLIGIISHVEELEGRIANKIRVTKDKSGKSSSTVVSEF
ncbi:SMC family ATPase, partial [Treponema sp.]|uniref:SMC family ATPase n=1 Tax=Treponema sp. TaxID=166 RepID=UPI00298DD74D